MEFVVHEVVPETCNRTEFGRVVVNPPNAMGPLVCRPTGKILMCCNRAFLTEESYRKHLGEKREHGTALDFSKLSNGTIKAASKITHHYDSANRNLWIVRKKGCAQDIQTNREKTCTVDGGISTSRVTSAECLDKEKDGRGLKTCTICSITTLGSNMSRHMKTCHVPDGIKCDYCCCTFLLNPSRLRHQRREHGIRIRRKAARNFKNAIIAKAKKRLVTSKFERKSRNTDYICSICGKDFFSKLRLGDHMNSHSGSRPYECDVCGVRFSHCSNLKRHMRKAHTKDDKIFCDICDCGFSNRYALASHNKNVHSNILQIKKTKSEGQEMHKYSGKNNGELLLSKKSTKALLEKITPNSAGQFECRVCHKILSTQQTLRGHMNIHYDTKPYKCDICGVSFRLHNTRQKHILYVHTGNFKCKSCTYRFKSKVALQRHQLKCQKHNEKKPPMDKENTKQEKTHSEPSKKVENVAGFKCNLCGAVVRNLEDFEDHKVVHSKTGHSQCNMCLKKLGSIVSLKFHKKRAHGDATIHVHKCAFCCCRYKASRALYTHLVKEHCMARDDWDFGEKTIKPEARRRIQLKMCQFESKTEESKEDDKTTNRSNLGTVKITKKGKNKNDSGKPYECDICHLRFKLSRSIHGHKKVAHNFGAFVCGLCPCRYHKITWLEKHQLKVHGCIKPPNKTDIFVENSGKKPPKELTIKPNSGKNEDKLTTCNVCKFSFKNAKCLAMHKKKSHLHSGKFKCDKCPCKFQAAHGLSVHRALYHGHIGKKKLKTMGSVAGKDERIENVTQPSINLAPDSVINVNTNGRVTESTKKFECDLCHMQFAHRSTIISHKKKSHFHSGNFRCRKCTCKFETAAGLVNHCKVHHEYRGKRALSQSKMNMKDGRKNKTLAAVSAGKKENLEFGMNFDEDKTMDDTDRVECDQCLLMVGRRQLSKHVKLSHGSGSYCCSECSCVFLLPQGLRRHRVFYHTFRRGQEDAVTKNKSYVSSIETENTSSSSTTKVNRNFLKIKGSYLAKRNISKHSPSPQKRAPAEEIVEDVEVTSTKPPRSAPISKYKFQCSLCGIKFINSVNYKRHQQKAHTGGGSNCDSCSCTFNHAGALAAHKRTYHSFTNDKTPKFFKNHLKCKFTFKKTSETTEKSQFKRNGKSKLSSMTGKINGGATRPEAGEKKLGRKAAVVKTTESDSIENTTSHISSIPENNERSNRQNLASKKLNKCTWCRKAFPTPKLLEKHILSHTRPEVCLQCNMRFRTKDEVSKHSKVAHDERSMHQCLICSCRFATAGGLKAHTTMIHNKESASYENVVIEHDKGSTADEPFIPVSSSYSRQNRDDGFCEDSEPIVQGILETNYENGGYCNEEAEGTPDVDDVIVYDDSVPIVQGFMEYSEPLSPSSVSKKKVFSPKSRPIKCATCGITCYGPEKLRHHMESHQLNEGQQDEEVMQVDEQANDSVKKCDNCGNEFHSSEELDQHLKLEHDDSGFYRCAYCPCTMKTETNLRYHFMKYHTG